MLFVPIFCFCSYRSNTTVCFNYQPNFCTFPFIRTNKKQRFGLRTSQHNIIIAISMQAFDTIFLLHCMIYPACRKIPDRLACKCSNRNTSSSVQLHSPIRQLTLFRCHTIKQLSRSIYKSFIFEFPSQCSNNKLMKNTLIELFEISLYEPFVFRVPVKKTFHSPYSKM